jgi:hypothetical protein
MLDSYNTQQPSVPSVATPAIGTPPKQQLAWADWLDRAASAFDRAANRTPHSDRLAWISEYLREAADVARLHNLQSPGEHRNFLADLRECEQALAGQDGRAAPIQPGCLAGHPDQWDLIPTDPAMEDELPW